MSIYQIQRTMSTDTLVGIYGNSTLNGSKGELNTPTNGDATFNFQIIQKPSAEKSIANDLTGNTLAGARSENAQFQDTSPIEEMLNIEDTVGNGLLHRTPQSPGLSANNHKRLSISEYNSSKPVYYEYEFFEKGIHRPDEEDDIMVTDDEGLDMFSFPLGKARKDSVFSDYGNEMVMNLSPEAMLAQIPAPRQQLQDDNDLSNLSGGDNQQRKKVKDYFKLNLFGGSKNEEALIDPDLLEEPQPFLKKKYFWSRKPTIPISSSGSLSMVEPVVNPSELLTSNSIDTRYILSNSTAHFSSPENSQAPPELVPEAGVVKKKRLGFPKTRGRKPSPILDASKQFACDFCDRRFKRQEHLKRHVRSLHMGEKPFDCQICGKKFSRSDNLNQHVKTHSEGGPL